MRPSANANAGKLYSEEFFHKLIHNTLQEQTHHASTYFHVTLMQSLIFTISSELWIRMRQVHVICFNFLSTHYTTTAFDFSRVQIFYNWCTTVRCRLPVMLNACHKAALFSQVHSGGEAADSSATNRVSTGASKNQENRWIVFGLWKLVCRN